MTERSFTEIFDRVTKAYESLGYPLPMIQQWTLPAQDCQTLLAKVLEVRPGKVLEIGTFVGLTTQLLALYTEAGTTVHSIDPNLPLSVEMGSMKSDLFDVDTSVKTQELARKVSTLLELDSKIFYHEGGFSIGDTFASVNDKLSSRVQAIGETVCREKGPFDLIFIDGLHYEHAVLSDIELAVRHLAPGGIIILHDVMGRWGSNVRRAVFRFLENRDDFIFSHDRFAKKYDSIAFLIPKKTTGAQQYRKESTEHEGLDHDIRSIQESLSSLITSLFSPKSIIEFSTRDFALSDTLSRTGIKDVQHVYVGDGASNSQCANLPAERHDLENIYDAGRRYDLCLALGVVHACGPDSIDNFVQSCVNASDTIIFSCTPPGEFGEPGRYDRPLSFWVQKFYDKGYLFHDALRPYLEPRLYMPDPVLQQKTTLEINLYVITKHASHGMPEDRNLLAGILREKESRIEDLAIQSFFQNQLILEWWTRYHDLSKRYHSYVSRFESLAGHYDGLVKAMDLRNEEVASSSGNACCEGTFVAPHYDVSTMTRLHPPYSKFAGNAWSLVLPQDIPPSDDVDNPYRSSLLLIENGRPLLKSHALHQEIRDAGKGAYSHWQNTLIFSTPDNTDPNFNGRTYEIAFTHSAE